MSDAEETPITGQSNQSSSSFPSTNTTETDSARGKTNLRDTEPVPKLKSDESSDYEIWRDLMRWWRMLTSIPKDTQAPHVILHGILQRFKKDGTELEGHSRLIWI